jgi:hypothetical protein
MRWPRTAQETNRSSAPAESEKKRITMKKKYGVCFGILAMGLAIVGTPLAWAQNRTAANGPSGATETNATTASAPAASSPADLDRRVEELEKELVELRSEMAARKQAEETPAATPAVTLAQDKPADAKPPEKITLAGLLGPNTISGFVDTYYQYNYNHPVSKAVDFRAFDVRSKDISLNMIELILDKAPDPMGGLEGRTGYHVSLGFGDAMNIVNSSDPGNGNFGTTKFGGGFAQYLKEGYFSYLAPVGKGLQVDVGKFVTPMGAEVIESKDNWNYSRGLLFTYAIPFYHFGARAKYTFNDKYNVTGFVVNGWNNIVDNNSGKTYGFSFVGNPTKKVSYTINYLAGPETTPTGAFAPPVDAEDFWRQTWDAVVTYNPNAKLSLMANFDYGRGDRTTPVLTVSPVYWTGGALYAKYALTANDYVAARYEYFEDHDGFTTGQLPRTHFNEVTATYQHTLATHLLTRFEYRRDMSQFPVYELSTFNPIKHQDTVSLGLIFLFSSADAK